MDTFKYGLAAGIMAATLFAGAGTASADRGGVPHAGSCGVGRAESAEFRHDPSRPGASEITLYPPGEDGCTGKPG